MGLDHIRKLKNEAGEPKPKKRKPIAKISKKRQKKLEEQKDLQKKDHEFYMEVWNASPYSCIECHRKLGRIPNTMYFHHLLEKRNYPQYRHIPENIAIVCPDCHQQTEADIDKTPRIKQRRLEAEQNCHKWEIEQSDC